MFSVSFCSSLQQTEEALFIQETTTKPQPQPRREDSVVKSKYKKQIKSLQTIMDLPKATNQPSAENLSSSESIFLNTIIKHPNPLFISQLYTTGKYTDLIIKCQGKEFKVHRAIICSQSKPLAAAIDHGFKEAGDGVFDFEEDEPEIVEYMIRYLYDGLYSVSKQQKHPDTATWGGNATSVMPDGTSLTGDSASRSDAGFYFTTRSSRAPANSATSGLEKLFGSASPATQKLFPSSNGASIFGPPQAPRDSGRNMFSYIPQPGEKPSLFSLYRDVSPHATRAPASENLFRPVSPSRSTSSLFSPAVPVNTPATGKLFGPINLFGGRTENTLGNTIDAAKTPIQLSKGKLNWSGRSGLFARSATYGQSSENIELQAKDLIKHAKVYIMAEKYDIQPLKRLARQRYSFVACNYWNSCCFVQSIELIFDGTPDISQGDDLRKAVLEVASRYMKQLLAREDFAQMCQERGDIGFAILQWSSWSIQQMLKLSVLQYCYLAPRSSPIEKDERWSVTETDLRRFDMSDQHSFIVNAALSYIYTSEYNDDPSGTYSNLKMLPRILPLPHQPPHSFTPAQNLDDSRLVFNTELYIFARKYKIEMLERLAVEKFCNVAHLPSPPLFNSNTDVLERRPAFVAAGSLLCDNMPDLVDRKSDELWRAMKVISFTNYMVLKDARWKDGEETRIFWEREDFVTELLETGWHLHRDVSMRLRNMG
ncbi:hypothetical protein BHYA_0003g00940 [Botrytis hyacinthi]|uniref:BTB domain-containing protein n=1 Tax=Botrytis hyacinthi TaxID=278943 RepID=A0A4Z1H8J9_9HELO|nr:hypothetical protein BHYA_0003g00940 [Botrytis hyacinthi]